MFTSYIRESETHRDIISSYIVLYLSCGKMATGGTNNPHLIGLDPKWHPFFDREDINYESYQLLWVDIQLSELEDEDKVLTTLTKFRKLVNYTKAFDHWRICLKYIEKSENISTFLVCSAGYAKDIARELLFLAKTMVWKVYIYCKSNEVFDMEKLNLTNENKASSNWKILT